MSWHNTFRTVTLLGALTGLILAFGYVVGGPSAILPSLAIAALLNLSAYWFSDRAVLAMTGAREIDYRDAPGLYHLVARLATAAGLPMPRLAIIESAAPNAFATGRDPQHAVVAVTTGLLEVLDDEELAAVLGHELGHVRNRDMLISSVAATLAGAVTALAEWLQWGLPLGAHGDEDEPSPLHALGTLLMLVLAPLASTLIQFAISRAREFGADESGAELLGDPLALARALDKIEAYAAGTPLHVNPTASHLFIIPPLTGRALSELFSTHPSTAARIERLEQLAMRRPRPRQRLTSRWAW